MMCAEALWWRCHRRIIADYLLARGLEVQHILAGEAHRPRDAHARCARARGRNPRVSQAAALRNRRGVAAGRTPHERGLQLTGGRLRPHGIDPKTSRFLPEQAYEIAVGSGARMPRLGYGSGRPACAAVGRAIQRHASSALA
ncbi:MAG TPA: DUF488 family protein [Steroidobacteraceae bacterium]|nr:DUF488 family protein [Steroidobacteraceae bacterium]